MNYFTLKKTAALSVASLMLAGMVNAQTTDSTKTAAPMTTTPMAAAPMAAMPTDSTKPGPKVFGGRGQYKTFSIGINGGVTNGASIIGGSNDFTKQQADYGYGLSLRDQLGHNFGLQIDAHGGEVKGDNSRYPGGNASYIAESFKTKFWSASLSGIVNVATIDYIRRKNAVNFFVTAGGGLAAYNPIVTYKNGTVLDPEGTEGAPDNGTGTKKYIHELIIPVGVGVKFRLSDAAAINLGYTTNFTDGDNFDGVKRVTDHKDKYSYTYAGLEFTIGSKAKPSLEWVNPVAMMYDELYDAALRQEVEALKGRVANVETAVSDLKKDSDGDGVSDQFDKCPNTPAGTVVDGSGCAIVFPKADTSAMSGAAMAPAKAYSNIQFEFDSSVLKTSSYPILDATSADLKAMPGKKVEIDGYASSEGTAAHNLVLSKDRANSVKTYLVNSGVDAKHLKVKAYGETHPVADNSTDAGRVLNRRVEFKVK